MTLRTLLERLRLLDPKPDGVELAALACTGRDGDVSRRAFIGIVGTALAAMAVDPERLLWTPGEKTIVLPPPRDLGEIDWLLDPDWITRDVARRMRNQLKMANGFVRSYDGTFKPGDTIRISCPQRYWITPDAKILPMPLESASVAKTVDRYAVEIDYDAVQKDVAKGADREAIGRKYLQPVADKLTSKVDVFVGEPPLRFVGVERSDVVWSDRDGVRLRSMVYYDALAEDERQRMRMRFDVQGFKA